MSLADLLKSNRPAESQPSRDGARVYIRVSHERSAEKNISPETQRRSLQAYCTRQGYEIREWYTELAKSAFRDDDRRVEFHRMLADAKRDPATTVIVVYKFDRFSRSNQAQSQQADLLRHGVRIESATEGYHDPDTATGALMTSLTWGVNRMFSINLRDVVIPNMKTNFEQRDPGTGWAFKNGGWAQWGYRTQRVPYGKDKHGDIHKQIWVLDDRMVAGRPVHEWARTMLLEWRLTEHLGYSRIARRLTELGIPTPSGRNAWSNSTVQSLVGEMSRLFQYSGYAFWNREDCSDRHARQERDPADWIVVSNAHPAIISEEQCEAIYGLAHGKTPLKGGRSGEASRFALSGGLMICKQCGSTYAGKKVRELDYYVCGSHLHRRGAGCGQAWYIPRVEIETTVLRRALRYLEKGGDVQEWVDGVNAERAAEWQLLQRSCRDRTRRLNDLQKKAKNLAAAIAASGPSQPLIDELTETNGYITRLQLLDDMKSPQPLEPAAIEVYRERLRTAIADPDDQARRDLLKNLVLTIVVDCEHHRLEGEMADPRSVAYIQVAAPRGVEPLSRP